MTLTVHKDVIPRSDEWYDLRRGIVTASVVGNLVTPKTVRPADNIDVRGLTALLVAERITGWTEPSYVSDYMWGGIDDEPRAREKYAEHYAPVTELGFMVEDRWGFQIGYSPDGLVGESGLIEIKSRLPKIQLKTILADTVPPEDMAQLQCGLLVSGREWIDYISYSGGMPIYVKRVYPQGNWFQAITDAVSVFEDNAAEMTRQYRAAVAGLHPTERSIESEMII
jgi:YqaJ-like viral recombinase domain